jgi:uncharacterized protein (TIGR03083 family)
MATNKAQTWQQQLADSRRQLLTLLQSLTPAQWDAVVFSEGEPWTVATAVAHVIDGERGMSVQVHKIRKGEETVPEGFDIHRWNAGVKKRMGDLSPDQLLATLETTRAKTLEVMDSLKDEDWTRTGRHPSRGIITIEQYYETMAGHELQHTTDMRKALGL